MLYNYQGKKRTYCKCIGIDNNEYIVRSDALQSGATNSIKGACKTGKISDISNVKFGKLLAIKPIEKRAKNGNVFWECRCDCGNITYLPASVLIKRHTTSCGCSKKAYIESCKVDIIGKVFGKLTVIQEIEDLRYKRRMMKCLCGCGNTVICSVSDLTTGHTMSCGCMNASKGELFIKNYLNENNISYIFQKRFNDCKNIKTLPFDFYLPDYRLCIEYDGEQHFNSIDFWGGEEALKQRQINDEIKNEYCNKNNIKIIRLSYKDKKEEMIKILNNIIYPATITA